MLFFFLKKKNNILLNQYNFFNDGNLCYTKINQDLIFNYLKFLKFPNNSFSLLNEENELLKLIWDSDVKCWFFEFAMEKLDLLDYQYQIFLNENKECAPVALYCKNLDNFKKYKACTLKIMYDLTLFNHQNKENEFYTEENKSDSTSHNLSENNLWNFLGDVNFNLNKLKGKSIKKEKNFEELQKILIKKPLNIVRAIIEKEYMELNFFDKNIYYGGKYSNFLILLNGFFTFNDSLIQLKENFPFFYKAFSVDQLKFFLNYLNMFYQNDKYQPFCFFFNKNAFSIFYDTILWELPDTSFLLIVLNRLKHEFWFLKNNFNIVNLYKKITKLIDFFSNYKKIFCGDFVKFDKYLLFLNIFKQKFLKFENSENFCLYSEYECKVLYYHTKLINKNKIDAIFDFLIKEKDIIEKTINLNELTLLEKNYFFNKAVSKFILYNNNFKLLKLNYDSLNIFKEIKLTLPDSVFLKIFFEKIKFDWSVNLKLLGVFFNENLINNKYDKILNTNNFNQIIFYDSFEFNPKYFFRSFNFDIFYFKSKLNFSKIYLNISFFINEFDCPLIYKKIDFSLLKRFLILNWNNPSFTIFLTKNDNKIINLISEDLSKNVLIDWKFSFFLFYRLATEINEFLIDNKLIINYDSLIKYLNLGFKILYKIINSLFYNEFLHNRNKFLKKLLESVKNIKNYQLLIDFIESYKTFEKLDLFDNNYYPYLIFDSWDFEKLKCFLSLLKYSNNSLWLLNHNELFDKKLIADYWSRINFLINLTSIYIDDLVDNKKINDLYIKELIDIFKKISFKCNSFLKFKVFNLLHFCDLNFYGFIPLLDWKNKNSIDKYLVLEILNYSCLLDDNWKKRRVLVINSNDLIQLIGKLKMHSLTVVTFKSNILSNFIHWRIEELNNLFASLFYNKGYYLTNKIEETYMYEVFFNFIDYIDFCIDELNFFANNYDECLNYYKIYGKKKYNFINIYFFQKNKYYLCSFTNYINIYKILVNFVLENEYFVKIEKVLDHYFLKKFDYKVDLNLYLLNQLKDFWEIIDIEHVLFVLELKQTILQRILNFRYSLTKIIFNNPKYAYFFSNDKNNIQNDNCFINNNFLFETTFLKILKDIKIYFGYLNIYSIKNKKITLFSFIEKQHLNEFFLIKKNKSVNLEMDFIKNYLTMNSSYIKNYEKILNYCIFEKKKINEDLNLNLINTYIGLNWKPNYGYFFKVFSFFFNSYTYTNNIFDNIFYSYLPITNSEFCLILNERADKIYNRLFISSKLKVQWVSSLLYSKPIFLNNENSTLSMMKKMVKLLLNNYIYTYVISDNLFLLKSKDFFLEFYKYFQDIVMFVDYINKHLKMRLKHFKYFLLGSVKIENEKIKFYGSSLFFEDDLKLLIKNYWSSIKKLEFIDSKEKEWLFLNCIHEFFILFKQVNSINILMLQFLNILKLKHDKILNIFFNSFQFKQIRSEDTKDILLNSIYNCSTNVFNLLNQIQKLDQSLVINNEECSLIRRKNFFIWDSNFILSLPLEKKRNLFEFLPYMSFLSFKNNDFDNFFVSIFKMKGFKSFYLNSLFYINFSLYRKDYLGLENSYFNKLSEEIYKLDINEQTKEISFKDEKFNFNDLNFDFLPKEMNISEATQLVNLIDDENKQNQKLRNFYCNIPFFEDGLIKDSFFKQLYFLKKMSDGGIFDGEVYVSFIFNFVNLKSLNALNSVYASFFKDEWSIITLSLRNKNYIDFKDIYSITLNAFKIFNFTSLFLNNLMWKLEFLKTKIQEFQIINQNDEKSELCVIDLINENKYEKYMLPLMEIYSIFDFLVLSKKVLSDELNFFKQIEQLHTKHLIRGFQNEELFLKKLKLYENIASKSLNLILRKHELISKHFEDYLIFFQKYDNTNNIKNFESELLLSYVKGYFDNKDDFYKNKSKFNLILKKYKF